MGGGCEERRWRGDVICNNIHAVYKLVCVPLVCMCVHALVLRASRLALINHLPVF